MGEQSCANPDCDLMLNVKDDFSGLVYCERHSEIIKKEQTKLEVPDSDEVRT